ncbi:hypothetical protein D3C75_960350 [compost metagenome]
MAYDQIHTIPQTLPDVLQIIFQVPGERGAYIAVSRLRLFFFFGLSCHQQAPPAHTICPLSFFYAGYGIAGRLPCLSETIGYIQHKEAGRAEFLHKASLYSLIIINSLLVFIRYAKRLVLLLKTFIMRGDVSHLRCIRVYIQLGAV